MTGDAERDIAEGAFPLGWASHLEASTPCRGRRNLWAKIAARRRGPAVLGGDPARAPPYRRHSGFRRFAFLVFNFERWFFGLRIRRARGRGGGQFTEDLELSRF